MLAFILAERLRVVDPGVDQLDAGPADGNLKAHLQQMQPTGEHGAVVRQQLAGQPVAGRRGAHRLPTEHPG